MIPTPPSVIEPATLSIGDRVAGAGKPALIIAEIGVNHDGSLDRAKELVRLARDAGADAVKLQLFTARQLMNDQAEFADYQQTRVNDNSPAEMLARYELPPDAVAELVTLITALGMIPLATPFSPADVDVLARLNLPGVKIASPDLVNLPLLRKVMTLQKPLLISTGAATMEEITAAVAWLTAARHPFALLHCISSYPTPTDQAHLCWIKELATTFGVVTGLSDHTTVEMTGALAVAAGAVVIEKHFTYETGAAGPDHAASADPIQFARYVGLIRQAEQLLGAPGKRVLEIEQDVRRVSRQSLVAAVDLKAGRPIAAADLTVQRPGTGVPAAQVDQIIGQTPRRDIPRGTLLQLEMLRQSSELA